MRQRITELTPAQRARMQSWAEEWIQKTFCTEPADRERFEVAANDCLQLAGLKRVPVIWVASPVVGAFAAPITANVLELLRRYERKYWVSGKTIRVDAREITGHESWMRADLRAVAGGLHKTTASLVEYEQWSEISSAVASPVRAAVADSVGRMVRNEVSRAVGSPISPVIDAAVRTTVDAAVGAANRMPVRFRRGRRVAAAVRAAVYAAVTAPVYSPAEASVYQSLGGWHAADFAALERFYAVVCGLDLRAASAYSETIRCGDVWWPFRELIIACERPEQIARDSMGRLHCDTGMAVRYRDGWGIYAWHGMVTPADVIEHPERISVVRIEGTGNVELRRVLIERYGQARFLLDSGAAEVHHDRYGTLYRKRMPGDEDLVMIRVLNSTPSADGTLTKSEALNVFSPDTYVLSAGDPSSATPLRDCADSPRFKDYFLRVPPDIRTAHAAVAWTFGMFPFEYAPRVQS